LFRSYISHAYLGGGRYFGDVGGESDERGSGIDCGAGVLQFKGFLAEGEAVKTDFPVPTSSDREPSDFAGIMILVVSTKHGFSTIVRVLVRIAEIERKYFVINQLPVSHIPRGSE
jgi:hypothetical protein